MKCLAAALLLLTISCAGLTQEQKMLIPARVASQIIDDVVVRVWSPYVLGQLEKCRYPNSETKEEFWVCLQFAKNNAELVVLLETYKQAAGMYYDAVYSGDIALADRIRADIQRFRDQILGLLGPFGDTARDQISRLVKGI